MASWAALVRYYAADCPTVARFRWDMHTFGASWTFLVAAELGYLLLLLLLAALLRLRKRPIPLGPLPALHNALLAAGSLLMFVGCAVATAAEMRENSARGIWRRRRGGALGGAAGGAAWLLCFPLGTRTVGRAFFWSYVYYLSKLYELLDTVILLLRKKPLTFLHVFHHAMVMVMCFLWLHFTQSLQLLGVLVNTAVHVAMYSYFCLTSLGLPVPPAWKRALTNLQIAQFVSSFLLSAAMLALHFRGAAGGCSGIGAWAFNAAFNAVLLLLFVNFRRRRYYGHRKVQ